MRCFCRDQHGHLDPNCREHDLTGNIYREEHEIEALVTAVNQHKDLIETGIAFPGDAVLSPLTEDVVSTGDKIIFTWPLPHGEGDALRRSYDDGDTLFYEATRAIYCGDQDGNKYRQGIDFLLREKRIVWQWPQKPLEGTAPATGTRYVVKYKGFIEWVAFDVPMERISHGNDIGSRVVLRKLHLVRA